MRIEVIMPQLGESVVEGVVAKWLVKPGDAVAKDQPLVEISTDKVDAEIPSPAAGVVVEILAKEGETVPIQAVIARIDTEKAAAKEPEAAPLKAPWDEETEGFPGAMARRTEPPLPAPPRAEPPKAAPTPPPAEGPKLRISPVVARMAAEHGLDLSRIKGTGIDGRVTRKDVEDFLAGSGTTAAPSAPPAAKVPEAPRPAKPTEVPEEDQVIPFSPVRKRIAEHMVMSKRTSAHVHTVAEVDMHRVAALRAQAKEKGVQMTYLPFVVSASVAALREYPYLNASVAGDSAVLKKAINMGIAVDTDRGLIVPVIRDAGGKSLSEIARAVEELASRAAAHRIMPDELAGGTFTISNPGPKGNLFGTAIINQPQVGILRMGQVIKRPVVIDAGGEDAIVVRPMMYLCLGYDHRIVDGVAANGFLFRVREILEAGEFSLQG